MGKKGRQPACDGEGMEKAFKRIFKRWITAADAVDYSTDLEDPLDADKIGKNAGLVAALREATG
eukprot:267921-Pyramimonas_sp.AAC.1